MMYQGCSCVKVCKRSRPAPQTWFIQGAFGDAPVLATNQLYNDLQTPTEPRKLCVRQGLCVIAGLQI
eukprot:361313-Chlamydomonas_euryale.AAC.1